MPSNKPISDKNMIRFLVVLVLLLALAAGYYHSLVKHEELRIKNLEKQIQELKMKN